MRYPVLVPASLVLILGLGSLILPARAQNPVVDTPIISSDIFGKANPDAPHQLSTFDFLIGMWECDVTVNQDDGTTSKLKATWTGRYILDGYIIADEYRMVDVAGNLVMLGINYRAWNTSAQRWYMKWLEALSGTWLDLAPHELGGVEVTDTAVAYRVEYQPGEIHYIRFSDITDTSFAWSVDITTDGGLSWNRSAMNIRATRTGGPE